MKFRVRNLWKKAYKEGRLNDIPLEVREQVKRAIEAGPKEKAFSQITKQDFVDVMDEHLEEE